MYDCFPLDDGRKKKRSAAELIVYTLESLQKSQYELAQRIDRGFVNVPKPESNAKLDELPTKTMEEFLQFEARLKEDVAACESLVLEYLFF